MTVDRSGPAFEAKVAAEAEQLAALVATNAPQAKGEPVTLPEGDPAALRAFWRAVGWNSAWPRRFRLHHPDRDRSAEELARLLEQLADESPSSPALAAGGLPAVARLVDVDRDGIGFVVTNEDDPGRRADPPMSVVIFDTGEISPVPTSYLNWCGDELVAVAFSGWFRELVDPTEIPSEGELPFPTLSPTTRLLSPTIWLLPADGYAAPGALRRVAFARPEDFTAVFKRPPKRSR